MSDSLEFYSFPHNEQSHPTSFSNATCSFWPSDWINCFPTLSKQYPFSFSHTFFGVGIENPTWKNKIPFIISVVNFLYFPTAIFINYFGGMEAFDIFRITLIQAIVAFSYFFVWYLHPFFKELKSEVEESKGYEIFQWILSILWWAFELFPYFLGTKKWFTSSVFHLIFVFMTWPLSFFWISTIWYLYISYMWTGSMAIQSLSKFVNKINLINAISNEEEDLHLQFLTYCKRIQQMSLHFQYYILYVVIWLVFSLLIFETLEVSKESKTLYKYGSTEIYIYAGIIYVVWCLIVTPSIRINSWILELKARVSDKIHDPKISKKMEKKLRKIISLFSIEDFRPQVLGVNLTGDFFIKFSGIYVAIVIFLAKYKN